MSAARPARAGLAKGRVRFVMAVMAAKPARRVRGDVVGGGRGRKPSLASAPVLNVFGNPSGRFGV